MKSRHTVQIRPQNVNSLRKVPIRQVSIVLMGKSQNGTIKFTKYFVKLTIRLINKKVVSIKLSFVLLT